MVNDRFGLEPEEQYDGKQQSDNRRRFETRRECVDRLGPVLSQKRGASCQTRAEWHDNEDSDGRNECGPRDGEVSDAQEQSSDRCEREDQDEVIDGNLGEGVVGVAVGELAPHKHHRGAWGDPEQNHARDVFVSFASGDEISEHESEEQIRQASHCEWFDQPIDDQCENETLGAPADVVQAVGFDLEHHRVDHQPDQRGDDQVDVCHLEVSDLLEHAGNDQSESDASEDCEGYPNRQETLEATQTIATLSPGRG